MQFNLFSERFLTVALELTIDISKGPYQNSSKFEVLCYEGQIKAIIKRLSGTATIIPRIFIIMSKFLRVIFFYLLTKKRKSTLWAIEIRLKKVVEEQTFFSCCLLVVLSSAQKYSLIICDGDYIRAAEKDSRRKGASC